MYECFKNEKKKAFERPPPLHRRYECTMYMHIYFCHNKNLQFLSLKIREQKIIFHFLHFLNLLKFWLWLFSLQLWYLRILKILSNLFWKTFQCIGQLLLRFYQNSFLLIVHFFSQSHLNLWTILKDEKNKYLQGSCRFSPSRENN